VICRYKLSGWSGGVTALGNQARVAPWREVFCDLRMIVTQKDTFCDADCIECVNIVSFLVDGRSSISYLFQKDCIEVSLYGAF